VYGNELCIPIEEFMRHVVVLGEPGYGKTITLLRLASMAVRYGMQVVYIDLKGSAKTAAQFVAVMQLLGVRRIKVYPREPYDGWRGDPKTLYNRLMQMVDTGTHPFYRKLTSSLVSLAVNAPGGPPKKSKEFLRRLDTDWLYRAYAGKTFEHASARRKITKHAPHLDDLSLTFEGFFDGIAGGALDGEFAFDGEDVQRGNEKVIKGEKGHQGCENCGIAPTRTSQRQDHEQVDNRNVGNTRVEMECINDASDQQRPDACQHAIEQIPLQEEHLVSLDGQDMFNSTHRRATPSSATQRCCTVLPTGKDREHGCEAHPVYIGSYSFPKKSIR
jgi:hypothetical protein